MYGGVRFGGTITIDGAFELGFDHVALCAGAGRPTVIPMKNGLAPGVRQASDFLMALQLTGAAKTDSIANLTVRLPVVVIGGGLTAIDTATESLAYYPLQVEKFLSRYETLVAERGEEAVRARMDAGRARDRRRVHRPCPRDPRRARGRAARRPRAAPGQPDRRLGRRDDRLPPAPDRLAELHPQPRGSGKGDGGGHPLRRAPDPGRGRGRRLRPGRRVAADPASRRPKSAAIAPTRTRGRARRSCCRRARSSSPPEPSRTPCSAARTPTISSLDGRYFRALDEDGNPATPERVAKPSAVRVLTHLRPDGRAVSFFGDLHPSFFGNVVKAMGGATQGYPVVSRMLARLRAVGAPAGRAERRGSITSCARGCTRSSG